MSYWEASGEVSELSYKSLLFISSKRSYCSISAVIRQNYSCVIMEDIKVILGHYYTCTNLVSLAKWHLWKHQIWMCANEFANMVSCTQSAYFQIDIFCLQKLWIEFYDFLVILRNMNWNCQSVKHWTTQIQGPIIFQKNAKMFDPLVKHELKPSVG